MIDWRSLHSFRETFANREDVPDGRVLFAYFPQPGQSLLQRQLDGLRHRLACLLGNGFGELVRFGILDVEAHGLSTIPAKILPWFRQVVAKSELEIAGREIPLDKLQYYLLFLYIQNIRMVLQ